MKKPGRQRVAEQFCSSRMAMAICCTWSSVRGIGSLAKSEGNAVGLERLLRRLASAAAFEVFDEHGEGFLADMMLHALRIQMSDGVRNTERLEELDHNLVAS